MTFEAAEQAENTFLAFSSGSFISTSSVSSDRESKKTLSHLLQRSSHRSARLLQQTVPSERPESSDGTYDTNGKSRNPWYLIHLLTLLTWNILLTPALIARFGEIVTKSSECEVHLSPVVSLPASEQERRRQVEQSQLTSRWPHRDDVLVAGRQSTRFHQSRTCETPEGLWAGCRRLDFVFMWVWCSIRLDRYLSRCVFDNRLISSVSNICWFQLLKCADLLLVQKP